MKTKLFLALLLFAAGAAAQSPACKKHPTWSARDCERVAKKQMWVGMTGEMLLESLGAPVRTRKVTTAAGVTALWVYERHSGAAFRDGECVAGCKTEIVNVHLGGPSMRVQAIEEN